MYFKALLVIVSPYAGPYSLWCRKFWKRFYGQSDMVSILLLFIDFNQNTHSTLIKKNAGEKHNLKRHMHTNVHCSTIYNSKDMETI